MKATKSYAFGDGADSRDVDEPAVEPSWRDEAAMDMDFDGPEEEGEEDGMGAGGWSPTAGSSGNWEDGGRAVMFPASNDAKMAAVLLCDVLGALCILLNAFVIVALIRNRRRVLANVFYVLVLHCAIVDLIRGGCLIAWGMPHLLIHTMRSIQDRLLALKINQFTLVILRSCNLLTIFNLLVFTTNEFIVIKYPLHYRRYFRRRTVLLILALCWLVSLLFGIGSVFSNFFESAHSVMVLSNGTASIFRELDELPENLAGAADADVFSAASLREGQKVGGGIGIADDGDDGRRREEQLLMLRMGPAGNGVTRRQLAGLSINVLSMLMIFVLCYVCLFTVLICYGKILRTIRQFQKCGGEAGGPRRVLQQQQSTAGNNNMATEEQQQQKRLGRTGSIYHKRSVHQQRTQQQKVCQNTPPRLTRANQRRASSLGSTGTDRSQPTAAVGGTGTATVAMPLSTNVPEPTAAVVAGAASSAGAIGSSSSNLKKKVSMPGSPQSGTSGSGGEQQQPPCGHCPNCTGTAATSAAAASEGEGPNHNRSRRCNSHRKWRSHLMSRHKYLIVIGTVLFVDVLFLFPYSGIQMVALLHLNNLLATSHMSTLIRWGLQILIGVHSVCQPLCYFRMTEFRRLACCLGGSSRRFAGSGSSAGSIFVPGASRSAKSVGSKSYGLTRDEDCPSTLITHKKSIVLGTLISEGSPINGHGHGRGGGGDEGQSSTAGRDRTNWVNPSVGERQMLLITQRRKWTRNLSLLCKEEGEELELFLSREYKRRGEPKPRASAPADVQNQRQKQQQQKEKKKVSLQKGGSLRDRSPTAGEEEEEERYFMENLMEAEAKGRDVMKKRRKTIVGGSDGRLPIGRRIREEETEAKMEENDGNDEGEEHGCKDEIDDEMNDENDEEANEDGKSGRKSTATVLVGQTKKKPEIHQEEAEEEDDNGEENQKKKQKMPSRKPEEHEEETELAHHDLELGMSARLLSMDNHHHNHGGADQNGRGSGATNEFGDGNAVGGGNAINGKPGLLRAMVGRLMRFGRWSRRRGGHDEFEDDEPTLLDSDWKRPGEIHQFRSYGGQQPNNMELRPKISDLSGLRSNSVFTPPNQSANPSRQPSSQWGQSGSGGHGSSRFWGGSGKK